MSWDFDFALSLAEGFEEERREALVEAGRVYESGRVRTRTFVWSSGRIGAAVREKSVYIKRKFGKISCGEMDWETLRDLAGAYHFWADHHHEWAAFIFSCAGYPAGIGGAERFIAPGPNSNWEKVSESILSKKTGEAFHGREEFHPLPQPERLSERVAIEAFIWRVGERQTPPEGLLVGALLAFPAGLKCELRRIDLVLQTGKHRLTLEAHEGAFVRELLAVHEAQSEAQATNR